jgi:hypothetical protein
VSIFTPENINPDIQQHIFIKNKCQIRFRAVAWNVKSIVATYKLYNNRPKDLYRDHLVQNKICIKAKFVQLLCDRTKIIKKGLADK